MSNSFANSWYIDLTFYVHILDFFPKYLTILFTVIKCNQRYNNGWNHTEEEYEQYSTERRPFCKRKNISMTQF